MSLSKPEKNGHKTSENFNRLSREEFSNLNKDYKSETMINFNKPAPTTKAVSLSPYRQAYTLQETFNSDQHYGVSNRIQSR